MSRFSAEYTAERSGWHSSLHTLHQAPVALVYDFIFYHSSINCPHVFLFFLSASLTPLYCSCWP
jgi:hypothetical protein